MNKGFPNAVTTKLTDEQYDTLQNIVKNKDTTICKFLRQVISREIANSGSLEDKDSMFDYLF